MNGKLLLEETFLVSLCFRIASRPKTFVIERCCGAMRLLSRSMYFQWFSAALDIQYKVTTKTNVIVIIKLYG